MSFPRALQLIRRLELLGRKLADRLQQPVAPVGESKEALVDERLQRVEIGVADVFGGFQRAAAGEDGQARKELLLLEARAGRRTTRWSLSASPGVGHGRGRPSRSRAVAESRCRDLLGVSTLVRAAASSMAEGSPSSFGRAPG